MWLEKIFCKHEWELKKTREHFYITESGEQIGNIPHGHDYIYICKKCGKIKIIKF